MYQPISANLKILKGYVQLTSMLVRCLVCAKHLYLYLLKVVSFKFDASDGALYPLCSALSISNTTELTSIIMTKICTYSKSCSSVLSWICNFQDCIVVMSGKLLIEMINKHALKDSSACCVRDPAGSMLQLSTLCTSVPSATVQSMQRYPSFLSKS